MLPQSLITLTPKVNQELHCWKNYKDEEGGKAGKDKYWVETSVTVKVREIDEKIREGKNRRIRTEMVLLYDLEHIASVLFLSHFWRLVPVFSIVYIWLTPVKVSSENFIQVLTIVSTL